ncbi:MAG: hypothetical protein J6B25_03610 [Clostridia bacterium]|nr:hypothetical protein [Clostridia bacterium]
MPRTALGLTDEEIKFSFKWSDNLQGEDATAFYQNGDAAPGGRFAFVFDSTATGKTQADVQDRVSFDFFDGILEKLESFYIEFRKYLNYIFR